MKTDNVKFYSLLTSAVILLMTSQNIRAQESSEEVKTQNLEISLDCSEISKKTQEVSLQASISGKMRGIAITGWVRRNGGMEALYGPSADHENFTTKLVLKADICDDEEVKLSAEDLIEKAEQHLKKEYMNFRNPKISSIKLDVVSRAKSIWPSKKEHRSQLANFDLEESLFVLSSESISGYAGLFIVNKL